MPVCRALASNRWQPCLSPASGRRPTATAAPGRSHRCLPGYTPRNATGETLQAPNSASLWVDVLIYETIPCRV